MSKHLAFIAATYLALTLQASVAPQIAVSGCLPQLPLVVMVLAWHTLGGGAALVWAAIAGLAADCLSPGPLGPCMLSATIVVFTLLRSTSPALRRSAIAFLPVTFLIVLLVSTGAEVGRSATFGEPIALAGLVELGSAAYTTVVAFGLLMVGRLVRAVLPMERSWSVSPSKSRWTMLAER